MRGRPGAGLKPLNLEKDQATNCPSNSNARPRDDDLYSHLMYPEVFAEFAKFERDYSDVAVLPTPRLFLRPQARRGNLRRYRGGQNPFHQTHPSRRGGQGRPPHRHLRTQRHDPRDRPSPTAPSKSKAKARPKADPADPWQVGAPIPGLITALAVSVGSKVKKGDKLLTLEAMKMQSTIYAAGDGTVESIYAQVGETVASKDLLIQLRK